MILTIENLEKYKIYLKYIDKKLSEFFEEQSPYIFCKKGCSHCCENGEYPFSELEFAYLSLGTRSLPTEIVKQIDEKIKTLKTLKEQHSKKEPFTHVCPFLIDQKCCIYDYRGIICRAHGLAFFSKENKILVPDCVHKGLNYSNVYDFEHKKISMEKFKKTGIKQEPLAHNTRLGFLISNTITKELKLEFGDIKPLIDWFE